MSPLAGTDRDARMQRLAENARTGPLGRSMARFCVEHGFAGYSIGLDAMRWSGDVRVTAGLARLAAQIAASFRSDLSAAGVALADIDFAYLLFTVPPERGECTEVTLRAVSKGAMLAECLSTVRIHPPLPSALVRQLADVEPNDLHLHPCRVRLRDGGDVDRVFLAAASTWFLRAGFWPDAPHARQIPVERLKSLEESPSRLPARFANQIHAAGETAMGMTRFAVCFVDGTRRIYSSGSLAADFIEHPPGLTGTDIVAVHPHAIGSPAEQGHAPRYGVCLFGSPEPAGADR